MLSALFTRAGYTLRRMLARAIDAATLMFDTGFFRHYVCRYYAIASPPPFSRASHSRSIENVGGGTVIAEEAVIIATAISRFDDASEARHGQLPPLPFSLCSFSSPLLRLYRRLR